MTRYVLREPDYEALYKAAIVAVPDPLREVLTGDYLGRLSDRFERMLIVSASFALSSAPGASCILPNSRRYLAVALASSATAMRIVFPLSPRLRRRTRRDEAERG